ncbi:MAG: hypothetical protein EBX52_10175, partial [Proteobacteria bacterium]|nr:hypothetical protein [Pseudomonadota bacterium]
MITCARWQAFCSFRGRMNAYPLLFASLVSLMPPSPESFAGELKDDLKPVLGAAYFSEQEALSGGSCLENARLTRAGE